MPAWTRDALLRHFRGGLIVSCQPVPGSPLDTVEIVRATALAVVGSGAIGLRIESEANARAVAAATDLPVIGLIKRQRPAPERLFITPGEEEIDTLAAAGAAVIAFDATHRERSLPVADAIARIRARGRLALADCATVEEGRAAAAAGADLVASTLSGYTGPDPEPDGPDLDLVRALASAGLAAIAEGRIRYPAPFNYPHLRPAAGAAIVTASTYVWTR